MLKCWMVRPGPPFVLGTEHRCVRGPMRRVAPGTKLAAVMRMGVSYDG